MTINFAVRFRVGRKVLLVARSEQRLCWPATLLNVWVKACNPYHHRPDKLSGLFYFHRSGRPTMANSKHYHNRLRQQPDLRFMCITAMIHTRSG